MNLLEKGRWDTSIKGIEFSVTSFITIVEKSRDFFICKVSINLKLCFKAHFLWYTSPHHLKSAPRLPSLYRTYITMMYVAIATCSNHLMRLCSSITCEQSILSDFKNHTPISSTIHIFELRAILFETIDISRTNCSYDEIICYQFAFQDLDP